MLGGILEVDVGRQEVIDNPTLTCPAQRYLDAPHLRTVARVALQD